MILIISLNVITTISIINKANPTACIIFSTFISTLLPFIFSINRNSILPPSSAGIGSTFINPTFRLMNPVKYIKFMNPALADSPTTLNIPTVDILGMIDYYIALLQHKKLDYLFQKQTLNISNLS